MQDELLLGVTQQQQPGSERLSSSLASGHPPFGHPSSDFKPCLSPHQDLNKQQAQQPQPPPPQLSQKRKEFKQQQQLSSPAQLGSSHPLNNHHPPDYHHHPPQQQQQFSHPTDKYQQQEHRQQQQLQLLSAHPPEPPRTGDHPHHRALGPAEHQGGADRGGSERLAPSCPGESASADPNVGVAAASCVNPPPSPHLQARAKLPPMESPPNSHLLGSPGNLLPGGLGSGFSSLQSPEIPSPHHQSGGGSSSAASPPPPPLPGFGTPWSVQTSSPPPQQTQQPPVSSGGGGGGQISTMPPPSPESETSFYPGIPSSINPAFFQSFSPVSPHNPCAGPFSSPFSAAPPPPPQMNLPQQQQQQQQNRRSPVSPQLQHQHQAAAAAAAFLQQRNSYNHHQDRNRMYDSLNMHSLENSLIDIMRAEHDPLKGRLSYPHPGTDNLLMLNGRSSLFPIDDGLLDDGHSDQVGVLNSPTCYSAHQNGERIERFSRKVFVGGLPPDIDEDEITASFRRFGPLVVDWPHKAESKSYFPPKGSDMVPLHTKSKTCCFGIVPDQISIK
ncbi:hypothetical protein BTVI_83606 [Pitangus sulphuratus]|nr:hypothetical protein BTVI_83606 [Pitangus sulphuratus]